MGGLAVDGFAGVAAVEFDGDDAAGFLQGQLTVNTEAMTVESWRLAAYCSRQGRIVACGILARLSAARFVFLVSADLADSVAAMLKKFVMRAKVTVQVPDMAVRALPQATGERGSCGVSALGAVVINGDGWALQLGERGAAEGANVAAVDDELAAWYQRQIEAGVAWVSAATTEKFIPQFVNFDHLGAVDFDKGCYVGQEVIARLHHLGEAKRRAVVVRAPVRAALSVPLRTADGATAGELVNAVTTDDDGAAVTLALAVVKTAEIRSPLFLDSAAVEVVLPPPAVAGA